MLDSRFVIPVSVKQQQSRRSNPPPPLLHQQQQQQQQQQLDLPMSSERLRAMRASAFRAVSAAHNASSAASSPAKMTCLCAPTSHPGSFRCRMHRAQQQQQQHQHQLPPPPQSAATASSTASSSGARSKFSAASPRPPVAAPQISSTHKTCSRCRVRGPSRLSKVVCATGREETCEEPEIATIPIPLPVVRLSHHASIHRGISSAAIGARFCAMRRLQGSGKEDILRLIRPTNPRPILLST